jgi:Glycosyl transferase family 2.
MNDPRFVVIENEQNLHIGICRNKGIELSKGKYIAFCDHDDYMDPSMYADLITIAEKCDADIVVSPSIIEYENMRKKGQKIEYFNNSSDRFYFLERLVGKKNYDAPGQEYLWENGNMWNKIFKKEIINKNNIRFVDTKSCCYEDVLFQYRCFFNAENISTTSIPYYHHILFGNNTSLNPNYASSVNTLNFFALLVQSA